MDELTESYAQSSRAGISALMAMFYEELGVPVPEDDTAQKVTEGLLRIKELFGEVNLLFEKNGFSCRFDLCDGRENEKEALAAQVNVIVVEMIKSGMNNYMKR